MENGIGNYRGFHLSVGQRGVGSMERSIQERLKDLRLSNDMIELLKSGQANNPLLCELAAHPDFIKLRI